MRTLRKWERKRPFRFRRFSQGKAIITRETQLIRTVN